FWRSRFLIQDGRKLRRLQESRLEWVLIDTGRGIDVPAGGPDTGAAPAARPVPAEESAPPSARAAAPAPERSSPEQQAFDDAKDIIEGSREQVQQLFADAELEGKLDLRQIEGLVQDKIGRASCRERVEGPAVVSAVWRRYR